MASIDIMAMPHLLELLTYLGKLLGLVCVAFGIVVGAGFAWEHLSHRLFSPCADCEEPTCLALIYDRCPHVDGQRLDMAQSPTSARVSEERKADVCAKGVGQTATGARVVVGIDLPPDLDRLCIKRKT